MQGQGLQTGFTLADAARSVGPGAISRCHPTGITTRVGKGGPRSGRGAMLRISTAFLVSRSLSCVQSTILCCVSFPELTSPGHDRRQTITRHTLRNSLSVRVARRDYRCQHIRVTLVNEKTKITHGRDYRYTHDSGSTVYPVKDAR